MTKPIQTHQPFAHRQDYPLYLKKFAREMRSNQTKAEKIFWNIIKNKQTGFKFRRQFNLDGQYIADFVCLEKRLIIEIDGGQHAENNADKIRTFYIEAKNFRIIRFWNNEIIQNLEGCYTILMDELNKPPINKITYPTKTGGRANELTQNIPHQNFLRQALLLAQSGLGRTGENPSVGCVIVKNGQIIATARTGDGGRPHAESLALAQAGENSVGATVYVSLEPCAHQGKTPACAQSLINAKVARVVFALSDPNPLVNGKGAAMLEQAGIEVISHLLSDEAYPITQGFFRRMQENLPEINIKIASSLDGRIATGTGESNWITGELARRHAHLLRSQHDAILTGIGTILADNPMLNCRLDGLPSPLRVILDSQLRTPINSQIAQTAKTYPTIIFSLSTDKHKRAELENIGIEIITLTSLELKEITQQLAKRGINRLLIEGGSQITSSAINANIAQNIYWYRAPLLMGSDGLPIFLGNKNLTLVQRPRWKIRDKLTLGEDFLEIYNL